MNCVSIIICTLNRADSLRETLRSLRYQSHDQFEVIVVNGPSTDCTAKVIAEFAGSIRAEACPATNLSESRNIGIRAAASEIVAFIDDDALPEFDWLAQALPAFADEAVGGVGGIVFDHSGMTLQYRFSAANRFGEATRSFDEPYDAYSVPGSFLFPYVQGTNALFRRTALEEIGGFDETFDYYLDETDVCCRMVDAGYLLRQLPDAPVHHKFLPSSIRNHERVITNCFPIIKNQTYFAYRHALGTRSELEVIDRCRANVDHWLADARFHEEAGRLPPGTADRVSPIAGEAMNRGVQLGLERQALRLERLPRPSATFQPCPVIDSTHRRCITIVSGDYPPRSTGGIARFLGDLAPALAERGHELRVITRAVAHGTVDLEDGVWVHRVPTPAVGDAFPLQPGAVPEAMPHINAFLTASAAEIARIGSWRPIEIVYGPAWDVDVLGALRTAPIPVVTMLATPVAVAARHAGGFEDPRSAAGLAALMGAERELFSRSHLVHAISEAVLDTVEHEYRLSIDPSRAVVAAIGLRDKRENCDRRRRSGPTRVLFVGRLETRKGIDDLLDAIETLAPRREDVLWEIVGGETRPFEQASHEAVFRQRNGSAAWLDRIRFLGHLDDDSLRQHYEKADLVVVPSRYESFGLVMVEAMMHGRAQVSCRVGGITEVVDDGDDGLLVPARDPAALAAAVDEMLTDPERRRAMGKAGRSHYEKEFTIDAAAGRVDEMLGRVSFTTIGRPGVIGIDPGPAYPASGGHMGASISSKTRIVVSGGQSQWRSASLHAGDDGVGNGAQVVLRTRASLTRTVDLCPGWNHVEIPRTPDDVIITWRSGEVLFGGLVTVAEDP